MKRFVLRLKYLIPGSLFAYLIFFGLATGEKSINTELPEKPIVIVISSYNSAPWVTKNLESVFGQNYKNFRIIYIDDCSEDGTGDIVEKYVHENNFENKVTLIKNKKRKKKLFNIYNAYHSINDWDIIIQLDGDDWLSHNNVFKKINEIYQTEPNIWLTYGQFKNSDEKIGYAAPVPKHINSSASLRKWKMVYMPLRTFYAWLFKQIKVEDLLIDNIPGYNGQFFLMANDCAMMHPMIEMAQKHFKFVSEPLYVRNLHNPISGFRLNARLKIAWQADIKKKKPYSELNEPIFDVQKKLDSAKAECIFISENPLNTTRLLNSIKKYVTHTKNIYVICQKAHQDNDLKKLKEEFPDVTFIDLSSVNDAQVQNALIKALIKSQGKYVILGNDTFKFNDRVNCNQCIKDLEQTFAYGLYFNLHMQDDQFSESNEQNKVPCQHIKNDLYAWKFRHQFTDPQFIENLTMSLHRKKDILKVLNDKSLYSTNNIINIWEHKATPGESVGLFFQAPKAIMNNC